MKKLMRNAKKEKGFTLLEVIVTLTVMAIMASFLVAFMGTAITQSSDPVKQTRDLGVAGTSTEKIAASYACYLAANVDGTCQSGCDVCPTGCNGCSGCTWSAFKTATACNGGTVTTVSSGSLKNANFQTIKVTITTNNQKLISYFME